jgi:hypothetical protein
MRRPPALASLVTLSLLSTATPLYGFGGTGHKVIARLAELRLENSPKVIQALEDLVESDEEPVPTLAQLEPTERGPLARVAMWADLVKYKLDGNGTSGWHFTTIPYSAEKDTFSFEGACRKEAVYYLDDKGNRLEEPKRVMTEGNCSVMALEEQLKILGSKSKPKAQRLRALKFVVHLVGDIHQPMHNAEWGKDYGGNSRPVSFFDFPDPSYGPLNLHTVWDDSILEHLARERASDESDYLVTSEAEPFSEKETPSNTPREVVNTAYWAEQLAQVSSSTASAWVKTSPREWAWKAHEFAVDVAYSYSKEDDWLIPYKLKVLSKEQEKHRVELDEKYFKRAAEVSERGIQAAGVRLAYLLKRALDK